MTDEEGQMYALLLLTGMTDEEGQMYALLLLTDMTLFPRSSSSFEKTKGIEFATNCDLPLYLCNLMSICEIK